MVHGYQLGIHSHEIQFSIEKKILVKYSLVSSDIKNSPSTGESGLYHVFVCETFQSFELAAARTFFFHNKSRC